MTREEKVMTWFSGIFLLLLACVLFASCDLATPFVSYRVTCDSGTVDITYETSGGGTSQAIGVSTPWNYFLERPRNGDFLYVSAQNKQDHGSITVEIRMGDRVYRTETSTGAYCIATVSGEI
jgi:hypothetical protein